MDRLHILWSYDKKKNKTRQKAQTKNNDSTLEPLRKAFFANFFVIVCEVGSSFQSHGESDISMETAVALKTGFG